MNEVWYKVVTPQATVEIQSYEIAKRFEREGAQIELIYKYFDLDRKVDEKKRAKNLKRFGFTMG